MFACLGKISDLTQILKMTQQTTMWLNIESQVLKSFCVYIYSTWLVTCWVSRMRKCREKTISGRSHHSVHWNGDQISLARDLTNRPFFQPPKPKQTNKANQTNPQQKKTQQTKQNNTKQGKKTTWIKQNNTNKTKYTSAVYFFQGNLGWWNIIIWPDFWWSFFRRFLGCARS